jgi:hypothetical protein
MNQTWNRSLRSIYRKEPLSSFVLIVGIVDAIMGGVANHGGLLGLGLGVIGLAIALHWRLLQRQQAILDAPPLRYLPERSSSRPSLPTLDISQRQGGV